MYKIHTVICKTCGKPFATIRRKTCSYTCSKAVSKETRIAISEKLKTAHASGTHPGWHHVNSTSESYPEKEFRFYAESLFKTYNIVKGFQLGKYTLDFAFLDMKVDVEIDGSQHVRNEAAIEHDIERDKFTMNSGWRIYRISAGDLRADGVGEIDKLRLFLNSTEKKAGYEISELISCYERQVRRRRKRTLEEITTERLVRNSNKIKIIESLNLNAKEWGWRQRCIDAIGIKGNASMWLKANMPNFYANMVQMEST